MQRGEVYWVDLRGAEGVEIQKTRTCVVVQNDVGNRYSPHTIVVPITDERGAKPLPTHVDVPASELGATGKDSVTKCEQLRTVDTNERFGDVVSTLSASTMGKIDAALRISMNL